MRKFTTEKADCVLRVSELSPRYTIFELAQACPVLSSLHCSTFFSSWPFLPVQVPFWQHFPDLYPFFMLCNSLCAFLPCHKTSWVTPLTQVTSPLMSNDRNQNMTLQNMPFQCCELQAIKQQQMQKKLSALPICLEAGCKFTKVSLLPSLPERTKVNHRETSNSISLGVAPEEFT